MDKLPRRMKNQKREATILSSAIRGGLIGLAVTLLIALTAPIAALAAPDPASLVQPIAVLAVFAGGFIGALTAARAMKERPLAAAMLAAAIMLVPMFILSLILPGGESKWLYAVLPPAALAASAFLGALAASKQSENRAKSMKRIMKR